MEMSGAPLGASPALILSVSLPLHPSSRKTAGLRGQRLSLRGWLAYARCPAGPQGGRGWWTRCGSGVWPAFLLGQGAALSRPGPKGHRKHPRTIIWLIWERRDTDDMIHEGIYSLTPTSLSLSFSTRSTVSTSVCFWIRSWRSWVQIGKKENKNRQDWLSWTPCLSCRY